MKMKTEAELLRAIHDADKGAWKSALEFVFGERAAPLSIHRIERTPMSETKALVLKRNGQEFIIYPSDMPLIIHTFEYENWVGEGG
jgi:hypothetical protein